MFLRVWYRWPLTSSPHFGILPLVKTIKQTYFIHAPLEEVWQALVNPKYIDGWGGGPAKMDNKVGTKFSLWGGEIWGTNTKVISKKKLVQDWYSGMEKRKWEKPSITTFALIQEKNGVRIDFTHTDVPDENAKDIESGWGQYYLGPLKDYLEKKSRT